MFYGGDRTQSYSPLYIDSCTLRKIVNKLLLATETLLPVSLRGGRSRAESSETTLNPEQTSFLFWHGPHRHLIPSWQNRDLRLSGPRPRVEVVPDWSVEPVCRKEKLTRRVRHFTSSVTDGVPLQHVQVAPLSRRWRQYRFCKFVNIIVWYYIVISLLIIGVRSS